MKGAALIEGLRFGMRGLLAGLTPRARAHRHMLVEERLSLGPKKVLLYVTCDGRRFLIAAGAEEIAGMVPLDIPQAERRIPLLRAGDLEAAYQEDQ